MPVSSVNRCRWSSFRAGSWSRYFSGEASANIARGCRVRSARAWAKLAIYPCATLFQTISREYTYARFRIACRIAGVSNSSTALRAIALAAENVRMGRPCDYVNHVLVLRQDLRQGLNYIFDSLVWRKQTEREQDGLPLHAKAVLVEIRIEEWQIRDAMRNHVDLAAGHLKDFLQKLGRKLTHDNQTV